MNDLLYYVKRTRLLLLILPLISSFFFLSNFKYQKNPSLFSQGLRGLQSLILVHTWTVGWCIMWLIYCVHQNQAASSYLFFIFLLFSVSPVSKHLHLHLQNCFIIPLMAMAVAGGMWALLIICYIYEEYWKLYCNSMYLGYLNLYLSLHDSFWGFYWDELLGKKSSEN